jgi:hypothetical protein
MAISHSVSANPAQGNLFGTTFLGGSGQGYDGNGVVFEITP